MSPSRRDVMTDWYKDAVIYQLHVRSFADSNGDGTGDFDGLTDRLDYLVDLGVDTLWLMPFFPSPLRDDGYDISDYGTVNPSYGGMAAFRRFLAGAHDRGLRVVIELVLNHTSDQHPWFQRARQAPRGSRHRDWYVWSDTPDRYTEARIIFQDFETSNWTWDPVAGQYYWHRFYSHQPDLNWNSPDVRRAMFATLGRWMRLGVDGVRLDAVPYLFERDGTNCENLPETHGVLRDLRAYVDERFPGRMLLAEANQWPEDAVAYFGDGDECHMAFHFPVMPRLFMGVQMESRTPIVDILEQTPDIPDSCQWAMFLRNHDELTLEMVTDEERDYMYRRFAGDQRMRINLGIRRRLSPLLQDDRRKIELMNGLLFSLPGTPIVYYGDEIGMGDNVYLGDRDAVRTPMQWSADRNAGFSRCNPQQLFLPLVIDPQHHFDAVNVEAQRRNPASLWWWMRRLIALRRRHPVLGRGGMAIVDSDNPKVLSFLRTMDEDAPEDDLLVVANLSRHVQEVTLSLPDHVGARPLELFGQTRLGPIGEGGHRMVLGPHDFYWLRLTPPAEVETAATDLTPQKVALSRLADPLTHAATVSLGQALPRYIGAQRWFGNRTRSMSDVSIVDVVPLRAGRGTNGTQPEGAGVLVDVEFTSGEPQRYFMALGLDGRDAAPDGDQGADAPIVAVASGGAAIRDASSTPDMVQRLIRLATTGERMPSRHGALVGRPVTRRPPARRGSQNGTTGRSVRPLGVEQSNTSAVIDESSVLKVLRRVHPGIHPEVDVLAHLTERGFRHTPALIGTVEYCPTDGSAATTVATLAEYVPSDGDGWKLMRAEAARFYEWAIGQPAEEVPLAPHLVAAGDADRVADGLFGLPEPLAETLHVVQTLGRCTADLHRELADIDDPRFRPEPFTRLYQRSLYQSMRSQAKAVFALLRRSHLAAPAPVSEAAVLERYRRLTDHVLEVDRIRVHGDLHLAQVLERGGDVTFIDFEGEPSRPLGERSIKRAGLVDVAGMVRSFDYVAHQGARDAVERGIGDESTFAPLVRLWSDWTSHTYVDSYLPGVLGTRLVPDDPDDLQMLLDVFVVQKCLYEVAYELDNRPTWAPVPLGALSRLTTAVGV